MERQVVRGGATWGRAVTRQWERRRDDPARTGGGFGTEVPKHRRRRLRQHATEATLAGGSVAAVARVWYNRGGGEVFRAAGIG